MLHRPSIKAKPNTRFLGRIIKETTSHNAALLAKEAADAQARLDDLTETEAKKRRKLNPSASDIRRRQLGSISSILEGRKRHNGAERHRSPGQTGGGRDKDKAPDHSRDRDSRRSKHSECHEDKEEERRSPTKKREDRTRDERRHHRHERSRSPRPRHRSHRRHRGRSPLSSSDEDAQLRRSQSQREKSGKRRDLTGSEPPRRKSAGRLHKADDAQSGHSRAGRSTEDNDSDPLEDLIGPAPPPRSPVRMRGRGAIRGTAAMDSRFSEEYDPSSDVQLEPAETDDWDEALEAHRDRQKWKQQGAARLRAAGFTDDQIKKWETGGEKDIDDVRWTQAGEKREW